METTENAAMRRKTVPNIGIAAASNFPDEKILNLILKSVLKSTSGVAYLTDFVPQVGDGQGRPISLTFGTKNLPINVIEYVLERSNEFDFTNPSLNYIFVRKFNNLYVTESTISFNYDINLGHVFIISYLNDVRHILRHFLKIFESIIAFRKEANALGYYNEFFHLDEQERDKLDQEIGRIVHRAIYPHQTMIYVENDKSTFRTSFISGDSVEIRDKQFLPRGNNGITKSYLSGEISIIDVSNIHDMVPAGLESYALKHDYKSCLIVPVKNKDECYCLIVCLFRRQNAISKVEQVIVSEMANLLADYYRIWYRNHQTKINHAESEEILKQLRELLLMVDVLHDAAEDISTARGHLGVLSPRNDSESATIDAMKAIFNSLLSATGHLRSFFQRRNSRNSQNMPKYMKSQLRLDNVNIHQLLEDMRYKYRGQLHNAKINLDINCLTELHFCGIEMYIRRAVDNAIKNSIYQLNAKAYGKREIVLNAKCENLIFDDKQDTNFSSKMLTIEVVDNGPGVEDDKLEKIRERYFSDRGGMGLGVPIMIGACEAHGGSLDLKSIWGKGFRSILRFREMKGR